MLAYLQIADPALRKQVVRLAEKYAGHPQPLLIPDVAQDNEVPAETETVDLGNAGNPKINPLL